MVVQWKFRQPPGCRFGSAIPMFDGGHILVLGIEGLFRRDLSVKVKQIIMQIGFVLIIILFVFIILNDVVKRLPNGWDSLIPF